jgi:hypothetical protein
MAPEDGERPHEHPELQQPEESSGDATGTADEALPEPRGTDLLSLALLVFFVALIGVVGALLVVPMLF